MNKNLPTKEEIMLALRTVYYDNYEVQDEINNFTFFRKAELRKQRREKD